MIVKAPYQVIYQTTSLVPILDVIDSLEGNLALVKETSDLLESCVDGLKIHDINLVVAEISDGSLKEIMFATLFLTYQSELTQEVPGMIEKLLGVDIPDSYDSMVTVATMVLLYYTVDFVFRRVNHAVSSVESRSQLDALISDLSNTCNVPEEKIRKTLAERYKTGRLRAIAGAAAKFFRPSKNQDNAPIRMGRRIIPREVAREMPFTFSKRVLRGETNRMLENVKINLVAHDLHRTKQGWSGIIEGLSPERKPLYVFPPVRPEQIFTRTSVVGDVIAIMARDDNGEYQPAVYHLIRVEE